MKRKLNGNGLTSEDSGSGNEGGWGRLPGRWQPLMAIEVGGLPLTIYLMLSALFIVLAANKQEVGGLATAIALIPVGAFALAELGRRLPAIRGSGLETILVVFVPSYLVYINWIPVNAVDHAKMTLVLTDIIGLFITILIIGSIVSIERHVLIAGLAKIALPLCAGSIVAAFAGTVAGVAFGLKPQDVLFLMVAPVMGGGLTAGVLTLSVGYSNILGASQGEMLARMLPAVFLGNFAAIIFAWLVGFLESKSGEKRPAPDGRAVVLLGAINDAVTARIDDRESASGIRVLVAAALIIAVVNFAGIAGSRLAGFPAPLAALTLAAVLQLANVVSRPVRTGLIAIYSFCVAKLTYPVLFSVGMLLMPWEKLIEGFAPANVATIFAVVGSLCVVGLLASRWVGLRPADGAIVTIARAAMGGTGDIAILSASHRMELMAFAQISTRIGGAATVAAALLAVRHFGG